MLKRTAVTALLAIAAGEVLAQPPETRTSPWQVGLGAALIVTPRAIGADSARYLVVPSFDVRYGDWAFFDPIRGLGVQATPVDGITATAAIGASLDARRASDDAHYRGLGDIAESPALILGLDWARADAFVSTSVRRRIAHGNRRGTVVDADVGYNLVATETVLLGAGATARAMDRTYARNFLGVDAGQAAASGLPAFDARAGLQRAGLFTQIVYRAADEWTLFGRVDVARLVSDAGRSPVVERRGQTTVVLSVLRSF